MAKGWSNAKRVAAEGAFYAFLRCSFINSKDGGRICLGENLLEGQVMFITAVFDALEAGIHKIFVLKSRQLGISTIARALSIFWLGMHPGIKGSLVFDTAPHKDSARNELVTMIHDLPARLKFPAITGTGRGNRDALALVNDSRMMFMSAGVRKSVSSGTLGRSEGLSMAHLSELCSYDNEEGLKSFEQSLSERHPDRLYIYESTARGFNLWFNMWTAAREDEGHCKCVFLGWWSHNGQRIEQDDADYEIYGRAPPSEKEQERIAAVKRLYDYQITPEQLAWIRRKVDPTAKPEGDTEPGFETEDNVMLAEQAWTEDEAFQQTGSKFFGAKVLTKITAEHVTNKFKSYMFWPGSEFTDMRVYPAENAKMTELKVWEEPDQEGVYAIAVDPAFGENEENDRSAIQVGRCYADGIDQVAEYAWPLITTYQLAWVIAALMGWYGQGRAEVRYILELNGPGTAVFNELRQMKQKIDNARNVRAVQDKGLANIFRNVKTYIYTRPDSMGAGHNYHWVTNVGRKVTIMERLRDAVSNDRFRVRSHALVNEMKAIARDGDSIDGGSQKDDRVFASALLVHIWESKILPGLLARKLTRESEAARKRLSIVDQVALFNQNHFEDFFKVRRMARVNLARQAARANWRGR